MVYMYMLVQEHLNSCKFNLQQCVHCSAEIPAVELDVSLTRAFFLYFYASVRKFLVGFRGKALATEPAGTWKSPPAAEGFCKCRQ